MYNSKLIDFLKTLSNAEMREFGRFIEARSVKGSRDINALYECLKKLHPEYPEKKLAKEKIAKKIFPKDANQIKRLTQARYKLNLLLEDFLIHTELELHSNEKDFLLLHAMKRRKLDAYFFKQTEQLSANWQKKPEVGLEQLHHHFRLHKMRVLHPNLITENEMTQGSKTLLHLLDQYYFANKLYWTLCDYHNTHYFKNKQIKAVSNSFPIEHINDFLACQSIDQVPQIHLLHQLFTTFQNKQFDQYSDIQNIFVQDFILYNEAEQTDLLTFLTQLCYERYRQGEIIALKDLFALNCFAAEKGLLLQDGYIQSASFINIVNWGCAVKELDWVEQFIEEFAPYIQKDQADTIRLCKSILYLNQEKYEDVLQELAQIKFNNIYYGVQARAILLQAYYELEEYEELFFNLSNSFGVFLHRNKSLSTQHKKSLSNFLHFAKRLQKAKNEYRLDTTELKNNIQACAELAYKSWLLKKVEDL